MLSPKGNAQGFQLPKGQKVQKVKFQLLNNLIVFPMEVNGNELSFILDSGVGKPLLFNLFDQDSVQINNVREITIKGLGNGDPITALSSRGNFFKLGNIKSVNQSLYVVLDKKMNLSPSLGIPVHGIIGYDLFRDFVVEINYNSKTLRFHNPDTYTPKRKKRAQTLPLQRVGKKIFVEGKVQLEKEGPLHDVNLLVDSGSSDAVWLFEDGNMNVPQGNYMEFLGRGLNGNIYGKRTQLEFLELGTHHIGKPKAAFPEPENFSKVKGYDHRNGSLGGEVLKRFNLVFDYANAKLTLVKNGNFNAPFHYNLSGLDVQHNGLRFITEQIADFSGIVTENDPSSMGNVQILFENRTRLSLVPEIVVSGIRAGSPAADAGLREGDVILAVNGKPVHRYRLQEVIRMLNEEAGKKIRIKVNRYTSDLTFSFELKKLFEQNRP